MLRIVAIEQGHGHPGDVVRLDHDQRSRRRIVYKTESGTEILLDMHRPVHLRDGDMLRLDNETLVRVEALDEALIEIGAPSTAALVRIAWHLGNRHLPTQLLPAADGGRLRIRQDHVIAEMAKGLGGTCQAIMAPFDPEGGAYAGNDAATHGHDHDHGHGHGHHHDHEHAHG